MLRNVCVLSLYLAGNRIGSTLSQTPQFDRTHPFRRRHFLILPTFVLLPLGLRQEDLTAQPSVGHCIILYSSSSFFFFFFFPSSSTLCMILFRSFSSDLYELVGVHCFTQIVISRAKGLPVINYLRTTTSGTALNNKSITCFLLLILELMLDELPPTLKLSALPPPPRYSCFACLK